MTKSPTLDLLKDFLFPFLATFLIIVLTFLILIPKVNQVLTTRAAILDQEKQIRALSQKLADLKSLSEADLFDTSSLLLEALPETKDFYKILSLTRKVFNDNGASLNSFNFSPGKISTESGEARNDSSEPTLSLKLTFASPYENFGNLLNGFNKILPLVEIDTILFRSLTATGSASLPNLEGLINVKSYFAPLPKTIGKIETPLPKISTQGKTLVEELRFYNHYQPEAVLEEQVVVGKENPFP